MSLPALAGVLNKSCRGLRHTTSPLPLVSRHGGILWKFPRPSRASWPGFLEPNCEALRRSLISQTDTVSDDSWTGSGGFFYWWTPDDVFLDLSPTKLKYPAHVAYEWNQGIFTTDSQDLNLGSSFKERCFWPIRTILQQLENVYSLHLTIRLMNSAAHSNIQLQSEMIFDIEDL